MKSFTSQLSFFLRPATSGRNARLLLRFLAVLTAMVVDFSTLFHFVILTEGRQHSWVTGFYWERIILICTPEAEQRFTERYNARLSPARRA